MWHILNFYSICHLQMCQCQCWLKRIFSLILLLACGQFGQCRTDCGGRRLISTINLYFSREINVLRIHVNWPFPPATPIVVVVVGRPANCWKGGWLTNIAAVTGVNSIWPPCLWWRFFRACRTRRHLYANYNIWFKFFSQKIFWTTQLMTIYNNLSRTELIFDFSIKLISILLAVYLLSINLIY